MTYSFKLADEKHTLGNSSLELLVWSSKRDLIAVSNSAGEIFLRRLSWCKVWKLVKRGDNVKVTAITWKPDGAILAIGYSSGEIILVEVETGKIIHSCNPNNLQVTVLLWANHSRYCDTKHLYLSDSTSPRSDNSNNFSSTVKHSNIFNVLWMGFENSRVCGYLFGLFPCCEFNISEMCGVLNISGHILHISANSDQSKLTVILKQSSPLKEIYIVNLNTALVSHCFNELHFLGILYQKILQQTDLLEKALKNLHEAWEDALVDLESKMAHYKNSNGESSLSVDLMELLMFGHADVPLQKFLVNELTDKGLKRIGQAVELSYNNMQKLLVKEITVANFTLSHCLTQLNGLAQMEGSYSCLGLQTESCLGAFRAVGNFTAKTGELQQVIDGSVKYLKTFFRWLYVTILRLSEDPIPAELTSSSQQDVRFIANFLAKDLETDGSVRLDRIGQYLREEPLTLVSSSKTRPWNLIAESTNLNSEQRSELFQPDSKSSLIQDFRTLKEEIAEAFHTIPSTVGQTIAVHYALGLSVDNIDQAKPSLSSLHLPDASSSLLASTSSPSNSRGFYLIELPCGSRTGEKAKAAMFVPGAGFPELAGGSIVNLEFYNSQVLAVLVQTGGNKSAIFQISVELLRAELKPVEILHSPFIDSSGMVPTVGRQNLHEINLSHLLEPASVKCFDDFPASSFSLNCSRKVGALYSSATRKIRILEMEVDDDEDEGEGGDELSTETGMCDDADMQEDDMAVSP